MLITNQCLTFNPARWTAPRPAAPALDRFTPSATQDLGLIPRDIRARVGKSEDKPNVGAALGTDTVRGEMQRAGMLDVSNPPTEKQLQAYYRQHAPHHDLIAQGSYGKAAEAYRQDAAKLKEDDPQRRLFEKRADQLEQADHMKAGHFPPTFEEAKKHFRSLKDEPAKKVHEEYRNYTTAFYDHVQRTDPKADIVYDHETGRVKGEKGRYGTDTPEDFKDVSDKRGLSPDGRRLVDCEGYAWMGEQLYKEAGFHQRKGGSYMVMRGAAGADKGYDAHVMVYMERGDDGVWISNDRAYTDSGKALDSSRQALNLPKLDGTPLYYGKTEREALVHADNQTEKYQILVQVR